MKWEGVVTIDLDVPVAPPLTSLVYIINTNTLHWLRHSFSIRVIKPVTNLDRHQCL